MPSGGCASVSYIPVPASALTVPSALGRRCSVCIGNSFIRHSIAENKVIYVAIVIHFLYELPLPYFETVFFLSSVLKSFHSGLLYVFLQEPKYHRRLCLNFWIFNYYYFFVKMRSSTKLLSWLQCRLSGAGWNSACICNCIYVAGLRFIGSRCHWHFVIILCESFVLWVWPWIATCVSLVCMCSRIPELLVFEWCLAYLDETRISLFISIWLWGLVCDLYLGEENWCIG